MDRKITDREIMNWKPESKAYRKSIGDGLVLEIKPTGSKLWRLRYYYQGKEQMKALGKYPLVSLAEARKRRDEAKRLVEAGKHLTREKKEQQRRKAMAEANTFEKIARIFLEDKQANLNEKYAKQCLIRMEQHVFNRIGDLPIAAITTPDVVEVVEALGKRGTIETARRMKQLISSVFRYAAQRGLCQYNPAADVRGRDILPKKEERHHACIHPSELPELLGKLKARQEDYTKYTTQLMMLTFLRTSELLKATWDEIDWDKQEWHIPKIRMKMRRPHVVPLSKQAITLLKEVQKETGNKPFIFFSAASKSNHISNGTVLMGLRRMG